MRRDIGSEVVVAISAMAVLVFALAFAVLLGISSSAADIDPTASETSVELVDSNVDMGATATPVPLDTETPTATTTATHTPSPTDTATDTPDAPDDVDSAGDRAITAVVGTVEPLEDDPTIDPLDAEGELILTTVAPSKTPARTPSPTDTNTNTPTSTPTDTDTPTSTPTDTNTPTATPTPTDTLTPTATATWTLLPGATSGILPTTEAPVTQVAQSRETDTPAPCTQPPGWDVYIVQRGNTLFSIARAVKSTVAELKAVNCIQDGDLIVAGMALFVPQLPTQPIRTSVPVNQATGMDLNPVGCADPRVQITSPVSSQRVSGVFEVYGTANPAAFWYYKLEVRPESTGVYNFYMDSESPVANGLLGQIDAEVFGDGLHWVRLTVVDNTGNIAPGGICDFPVFFGD